MTFYTKYWIKLDPTIKNRQSWFTTLYCLITYYNHQKMILLLRPKFNFKVQSHKVILMLHHYHMYFKPKEVNNLHPFDNYVKLSSVRGIRKLPCHLLYWKNLIMLAIKIWMWRAWSHFEHCQSLPMPAQLHEKSLNKCNQEQ